MGADIKEMFTGFRPAVAEVRLQDLVSVAKANGKLLHDFFVADAIINASHNGQKVVNFRWDMLKQYEGGEARFYAAFDSAITQLGFIPLSVPNDTDNGRLYLLEPKK